MLTDKLKFTGSAIHRNIRHYPKMHYFRTLCTCKLYYPYSTLGTLHLQTMLLVFTLGTLRLQSMLLVFTSGTFAHANYVTRIYFGHFARAKYVTRIYLRHLCTCKPCYSCLPPAPLHMQTMLLVFTSSTFAHANHVTRIYFRYFALANHAKGYCIRHILIAKEVIIYNTPKQALSSNKIDDPFLQDENYRKIKADLNIGSVPI